MNKNNTQEPTTYNDLSKDKLVYLVQDFEKRLHDTFEVVAEMRDEPGYAHPGFPFAGYLVQEYWAKQHAKRFLRLVKTLKVSDAIVNADLEALKGKEKATSKRGLFK